MLPEKLVLVTGASGYVGGCLVPRLLEEGYQVRMLARDPRRLQGRSWRSQVEVVQGDLLYPGALNQAMQGVSTAYYLVHNMASGRNYVEREIESARNFASAAGAAGLEHVIYLGGLADPAEDIGLHLRSRIQTGDILRQGSVPVTEFRASLIIGSGSISFEMIRYLTEQFPILAGPPWMINRTQPIAIQNVLDYLISALDIQTRRGNIYEIGGKDVLTYAEAMSIYAHVRGLKRRVFVLPGIPLNLMAALAGLLTPVPAGIAGALSEGCAATAWYISTRPIGISPASIRSVTKLPSLWLWIDYPQIGLNLPGKTMHPRLESNRPAFSSKVNKSGSRSGLNQPTGSLRGWEASAAGCT